MSFSPSAIFQLLLSRFISSRRTNAILTTSVLLSRALSAVKPRNKQHHYGQLLLSSCRCIHNRSSVSLPNTSTRSPAHNTACRATPVSLHFLIILQYAVTLVSGTAQRVSPLAAQLHLPST